MTASQNNYKNGKFKNTMFVAKRYSENAVLQAVISSETESTKFSKNQDF